MMSVGLPFSFVGPIFLGTIFWVALGFGKGMGMAPLSSWLLLVFGLSVVVIPLLFRMESRTGGGYLAEVLRDSDVHGMPGIAFQHGTTRDVAAVGTMLANPRAFSSVFVEFFLFGPRMALGGYRQARMARRLAAADRPRAAQVLQRLLAVDGGIPSTSLLQRGETLDALLPTLAYLIFYEWIGVGHGWERVWIDSEARSKLRAAHE